LLEELKSKTAIDAVSENMNHAMSQLETSLLTEVPGKVITPQTASLLSNDPSQVVDFHSIKVAKEA
jgi:hypothetical protein